VTTQKPEPITTAEVGLGNVAEKDLVTVRTTMRPDQDLRVTQAEATDLEAQGLLVKDTKKGAGSNAG
jgi:hypothetical protein